MSHAGPIGETYVQVRPDTAKFAQDLLRQVEAAATKAGEAAARKVTDSITRVNKSLGGISSDKLEQAGSVLTRRLTIPLGLAGGAAVKFGSDFETAFSRIVGLTGTSAAEVDNMRRSVLSLAGQTTRSPQELANALYFIASAGLTGSKALEVLRASARAAAAGLGDTATVADLVTSAVNAYGVDVLSATKATDILTAAVRVGKAEPDALAGSLGRIIPVAKAMGVSFDQVAAATAVLTNAGLGADEAVTALRGILGDVLNPAASSEKQLRALGIRADELRATLREKGLLATLFELKDQIGGNTDVLANIIPNVRALTGALSLLGQDPGKVADLFDQVANSAGSTDKAFAAFQKTASFKLKRGLVDSQVAILKLSDTLLPLAADIVPKLASAVKVGADAFEGLPGPAQTAVVALAAVGFASGPVLTLVGNLKRLRESLGAIRVGRGVAQVGDDAAASSGKVSGLKGALGTLGVTAGLVGLGLIFNKIGSDAAKAREKAERFVSNLLTSVGSDPAAQLRVANAQLVKEARAFTGAGNVNAAEQSADRVNVLKQRIADLRAQLKGQEADAKRAASGIDVLGGAASGATGPVGGLANALDTLTGSDKVTFAAADAVAALNDALRDDPSLQAAANTRALTSARASLDAANRQLSDAEEARSKLLAEDPADRVAKADRDARSAVLGLREAKLSLVEAEQKLADLRNDNSAIASAEHGLAKAQAAAARGTVNKTEAVIDAEKKLADAKTKQGNDIAHAELQVEAARISVEQATADQAAAEKALADERSGAPRAKELAASEQAVADARLRVADATAGVADAERKQADNARNLEKHQRDVEKASLDVVVAQQALIDKLAETNPALDTPALKAQALADALKGIVSASPEAAKALQPFIDALNTAMSPLTLSAPEQTFGKGGVGSIQHRALGGPVGRGRLYTILEGGRDEVFIPNVSGRVEPMSRIPAAPTGLSGRVLGGDGGAATGGFHVHEGAIQVFETQPRRTAREVIEELEVEAYKLGVNG